MLEIPKPKINFINSSVTGRRIIWLNYPQDDVAEDIVLLQKLSSINDTVFINGCSENFANKLFHLNFEIVKVAKDAHLRTDKNHFDKKSLKQLIKRGLRNSFFEEVNYSLQNKAKLEEFKLQCFYGKKIQLKKFFNDEFHSDNRLFVLKTKGEWSSAILIKPVNNSFARTELILRRKSSPPGSMEALIYSIFNRLKSEGIKNWSLGDVPFVVYNSKVFSKEFIINSAGRLLRFAYNYKGLYNFKNKFNPDWIDVYLAINPGFNFFNVYKIVKSGNLLAIVIDEIKAITINGLKKPINFLKPLCNERRFF